ncbi:hypothetical protein ZWY2020_041423 [Hordeum vulgare]|nr:hypothetical protein ZWY2020_041423 [Hordeum vulgare]
MRPDYLGKGVLKAVNNVNAIIGPALIGKDPTEQADIDNFMVQELDGTSNEWGCTSQTLPEQDLVLPVPAFNVINGGSHAGNKLAMQEFMILPTGAASFKEAMKMGVEVYHHLKSIIKKKYGQDATNVGDEGGFAPNIQENKEGLELLKAAIAKAGYTGKVVIGMDVAASEFYSEKDQTYDLNFKEDNNDGSHKISGDSLKDLYKSFVSEYPIVSIEDLLDQDDWTTYAKMTVRLGSRGLLYIGEKTCNALLLKVNQIGSVTESIEAQYVQAPLVGSDGEPQERRDGGYFIADLSVGSGHGQIKTGAPCRSERLANITRQNKSSSSYLRGES